MKKIILGLVLSFFVSTSTFANVIIDDFRGVFQGSPSTMGLASLGDFDSSADRTLAVTGPSFLAVTGTGGMPVAEVLQFQSFVQASASFSATWDNFDGTGASLSPPVGSISGATGFVLRGVSWTGSSSFGLTLSLAGVTGSSATATVAAGASGANIVFLFTGFMPPPDLLDITGITLSGNTSEAGMFRAESLFVTPEPSSLILGGIGLVVMGGYGYRRRRKSARTNAA